MKYYNENVFSWERPNLCLRNFTGFSAAEYVKAGRANLWRTFENFPHIDYQ